MTTTTHRRALPWTFRRVLADIFTPRPRRIESLPELMTGREAAARAIYGEQVQWSVLDMAEYDTSPYLRGSWLVEADRRIADSKHPERYIASLHGYTPAQWDALPAVVKADLREQVTYADGFRR